MAQGFKQLVTALQRRYDYYSARAVAHEALEVAGLEKSASYSPKEWSKLLKATAATGDDLDSVWDALGEGPKGTRKSAVKAPVDDSQATSESVADTSEAEEPPKPSSKPKAKAKAKPKAKPKKAASKKKG